MESKKRYNISYYSAPTGYGWTQDTDSLAEVRRIVNYYGSNVTAAVDVWDRKISDCIYSKRCMSYKPEVNFI